MKKNLLLALSILLIFVLIFAWNHRWSDGPKQSIGNNVIVHKKDNWTGQQWIEAYLIGEVKEVPVPITDNNNFITPMQLRWALNIFWGLLISLASLFVIYTIISHFIKRHDSYHLEEKITQK